MKQIYKVQLVQLTLGHRGSEVQGVKLSSALVSCSVELAPVRSKTWHSDE